MTELHRWFPAPLIGALLVLVCLTGVPVSASDVSYQTPPAPLGDIIDAPPTPTMRLSPDRRTMLLLERPNLLPLSDLAAPELRLAGLRIRPRTNGPSRTRPIHKLTLKSMTDLAERPILGLPEGAPIGSVTWSPDGARIAFTVTAGDDIQLWVADVADARARPLLGGRLNAAGGKPLRWLDGETLIAATVHDERGPAPTAPAVPAGPVIRENSGKVAPARTYQDLLTNSHDEALFEYYLDAQLVRVGMDGTAMPVGGRGIVWDFDTSPDGRYVQVAMLHRPFSYLVPAYRFPRRVEIFDRDGMLVKRLADLPLQEEVPMAFGSVPTGRRSFGWRDDAPATAYWAEAQDGGNARKETDTRDKIYMLAAPFQAQPVLLATLGQRYGGIEWGNDELALVYSWWWKTRNQKTWIVRPGEPEAEPRILWDRSWEDRYGDPGDSMLDPNEYGRDVLRTTDKGRSLMLNGNGASPEGDRPFIDKLDLKTGETERLWRSEAPYYEKAYAFLDDNNRQVLTRRESRDDPPNYFARDLKKGDLRQLTDFPHPTPQLAGLQKELIRYNREDGVQLTATLYLPAGYRKEKDGRLPVLMWAYPQEFKSADAAGQVTDSPHRFDRVGWWSPLLFLTQGYAVLDDPTMPIVGEGDEEPNDTYVEQLVSSARAAVDEVVRRGVGDRDRIAIGGHSYGAFMVANLLAHSDLFRAGIARSGAYNRTLTPFGFQAEERSLWEAPEIYFKMSPFMHADKVDEPLLLIHGEADNNSGTFPMQSKRYYNALKGHGALARLVMLPHESHGYRARESILHMLWESAVWLEVHVKTPKGEFARGESGGTSAGGR